MSIAKMEDSVDHLQSAFGISIEDGLTSEAAASVSYDIENIKTPDEVARDFVRERQVTDSNHPLNGMYSIFNPAVDGPERLNQLKVILDNRSVLLPKLTADGRVKLCPATISDAGEKGVRLTILDIDAKQDPASGLLIPDQKVMLDGAVLAGSRQLGRHESGRTNVQSEPGHLLMSMAGALRPDIRDSILSRQHIVHANNGNPATNVIETFSAQPGLGKPGKALFEDAVVSSVFTYDTWPRGLQLVHSGIGDRIETSDYPNAVPLVQGLGYVSLTENPHAVDSAKRLVEAL